MYPIKLILYFEFFFFFFGPKQRYFIEIKKEYRILERGIHITTKKGKREHVSICIIRTDSIKHSMTELHVK